MWADEFLYYADIKDNAQFPFIVVGNKVSVQFGVTVYKNPKNFNIECQIQYKFCNDIQGDKGTRATTTLTLYMIFFEITQLNYGIIQITRHSIKLMNPV